MRKEALKRNDDLGKTEFGHYNLAQLLHQTIPRILCTVASPVSESIFILKNRQYSGEYFHKV